MGNQKQKWTAEEEDALNRGVLKHGAGKWKNILKDPEFAASLVNRSNIDLKDKWRNLNVAPGQNSKEKSRTPKGKPTFPAATPSPSATMTATPPVPPPAPVAAVQNVTPSSQTNNDDEANIPPRYHPMIFEALSTINDPNGSDINAIASFIEQKHKVPQIQNFRRALGTKLRRLVIQGKLEKVQNCYKIKDTSTGVKLPDQKSPAPEVKVQPEAKVQPSPAVTSSKVQPEAKVQPSPAVTSSKVQPEAKVQPSPALPAATSSKLQPVTQVQPSPASPAVASSTFEEAMYEASNTAAQLIADAESKSLLTEKSVRELEKLERMADHNEAMLELAEEMFQKCSGGAIFNLE